MDRNNKILFFDVDTQVDFIEKTGALYIPEAETLRPHFKQLIKYARINGIPVWGTMDDHNESDPELVQNNGPFPSHCMHGSSGQQKIEETSPMDPVWIENRHYSDNEISQILLHPDEIYFLKQTYNMFDNPNLKILSADFSPIVVFGVATDYCILTAVSGFRSLDKTVYLIEDAIKAVNPDDGQKALEKMRAVGAIFINTNDVLNDFLFQ
ncbi:MAG: cysteine hydrolase [Candidatus Marinimicrobia bacterium]|nr:cysteine hydrolase [Candidatus Neomarinimicrobiota bacterium]